LQQQGLHPIARNFRTRYGEIDLIMRDRDELVFVEVRLRRHRSQVGAAESVDQGKQARLIAAAAHYLQRHPQLADTPGRFDVVAIIGGAEWQIRWIKNAFCAP
jgi:putative endonuclease